MSQVSIHTDLIIEEINREMAVRYPFYQKQIKDGHFKKEDCNHWYMSLESARDFIAGNDSKASKSMRDALIELKRELGMRQRVYPNAISRGILTPQLAKIRLNRFESAIELLEAKMPKEPEDQTKQLNLFG